MTCKRPNWTSPVCERVILRSLPWLISFFIGAPSALAQVYMFGDSTYSTTTALVNNQIQGQWIITGANGGNFDSLRFYFSNQVTGTDTLIAGIWDGSTNTLIARSTDSALAVGGDIDYGRNFMVHFTGVTLAANTRYWVGVHLRKGTSGGSFLVCPVTSATDSVWAYATDALPLGTMSGGNRYLNSAETDRRPPRMRGYYSATAAPSSTPRRSRMLRNE
jgi:hypothetical protein